MFYSSHTAVNHLASASAETVHAVADSLALGTEYTYVAAPAKYVARLEDVDVIVFDNGHRRLRLEYQVTRTTSRSTKVFLVNVSMDNYPDMDGQDKDMRVTATYNENHNQVFAAQFDGYRYAAMGHALEVLEAAVEAVEANETAPEDPEALESNETAPAPEDTITEYVDVATGDNGLGTEINPADYAEPVARSPRLPGTTSVPTDTERAQAAVRYRAETAQLREDLDRLAREVVDSTLASADHLDAAAWSKRQYREAMEAPGGGDSRNAQAAHHRYRTHMAAYYTGLAPEAPVVLELLERAAQAGDTVMASRYYTEIMTGGYR